MTTTTEGILIKHRKGCAKARGGERCSCSPVYEARVPLGQRGKRISRSFSSAEAARVWREEQIRAIRSDEPRVEASSLLLREYGDDVLERAERGFVLSKRGRPFAPDTIAEYAADWVRFSRVAFGGTLVADLRRQDVQQLVDLLVGRGMSGSAVLNALKPLRLIYQIADVEGIVSPDRSPFLGLRLPSAQAKPARFLTPDDVAPMLQALDARPVTRLAWAIMLYAGLRISEAQALRWSDVDRVARELRVSAKWSNKTRREGATKTDASTRRVPFPRVLEDELDRFVDRVGVDASDALLLRQRAAHGDRTRPTTYKTIAGASDTWRAAGLPVVSPHGARHTYASMLAASGVPLEEVARHLGHADIALAYKLYAHLYPDARRRAADQLDAMLASRGAEPLELRVRDAVTDMSVPTLPGS